MRLIVQFKKINTKKHNFKSIGIASFEMYILSSENKKRNFFKNPEILAWFFRVKFQISPVDNQKTGW